MNTQIRASLNSAVSEQQQRDSDLQRLKDHVDSFGLEVSLNVPYDGNCFFHAISHLVGKSATTAAGTSEAAELRRRLVSFLESKVGIRTQ